MRKTLKDHTGLCLAVLPLMLTGSVPKYQSATPTDLLIQDCSTTFMTDGDEVRFSSWFELVEYFEAASTPAKDEFETDTEYRERLERIASADKDFVIYFTPSLGQYSHERGGFGFRLKFFHSTTNPCNCGWDRIWSENEGRRESHYNVRYDSDHLITSNEWPMRVNFWRREHRAGIREGVTTHGFFLREEDRNRARILREQESEARGMLRGVLRSTDRIRYMDYDTSNYPQREVYREWTVYLTEYHVEIEEVVLEIAGRRIRWVP